MTFTVSRGQRTAMKKGQVLAEYVLVVAMLCMVTMGMNRLFSKALAGYYKRISSVRAGVAGMGP